MSYTKDMVIKYLHYLNEHQVKQLYMEIRDELNRHYSFQKDKVLGDKCDVDEWEELAHKLLFKITKID